MSHCQLTGALAVVEMAYFFDPAEPEGGTAVMKDHFWTSYGPGGRGFHASASATKSYHNGGVEGKSFAKWYNQHLAHKFSHMDDDEPGGFGWGGTKGSGSGGTKRSGSGGTKGSGSGGTKGCEWGGTKGSGASASRPALNTMVVSRAVHLPVGMNGIWPTSSPIKMMTGKTALAAPKALALVGPWDRMAQVVRGLVWLISWP